MISLWQSLSISLGSIFVCLWLYRFAHGRMIAASRWHRDLMLGVLMGIGASASMATRFLVSPGVLFDLRATPITLACYFGGPLGGLIAGSLAAGVQLWFGGQDVWPAFVSISLTVFVGLIANFLRGLLPTLLEVTLLALLVAIQPFVMNFLFQSSDAEFVWAGVVLLASALGLTSLAAMLLLLNDQRVGRHQALLRLALAQVPDYFYVKDLDLKFVAANRNVVFHHGFKSFREMLGLTDRDLETEDRAEQLGAEENAVLARFDVPLEKLERRVDSLGTETCYQTQKVALRFPDGTVGGLVGITRDVTDTRRLEAELREGQNLLRFLIEEMTVGLALFDQQGVLRFCNERYRSSFPLTEHLRVPGTHIREILEGALETGEQVGIDPSQGFAWLNGVASSLREKNEQEVELSDGRRLHIQTRPIKNGASLVVVSDVSTIKGRLEGPRASVG